MPRKRKKRRSSELIEAIVEGKVRLEMISCGACRQRFPHLFFSFFGRLADAEMDAIANGIDVHIGPISGKPMENTVGEAAVEVLALRAYGWRFDDGVWRPTADCRRRWQRACEVVRSPHRFTTAEFEAARRAMAWGAFSRKGPRLRAIDSRDCRLTPEVAERFRLPTMIECIQCGAINRIAAPVGNARHCGVELEQ